MWIETLLTKVESFYSKDFLVASFLPVLLIVTALALTFASVIGFDAALNLVSSLTEDRKTSALVLTSLALVVLAYVVGAARIQFLRFWSGDWMVKAPFSFVFSVLQRREQERFNEYRMASVTPTKWSDVKQWIEEGRYLSRGDMIRKRAYGCYQRRGRTPGRELEDWVSAEQSMNVVMISANDVLLRLSQANRTRTANDIQTMLKKDLYRLTDADLSHVYAAIKMRSQEELVKLSEAKTRLDRYFGSPHSIKPTRLGNIVESFLAYPAERYQLDGNIFWSRLQHVIPESFTKGIRESRTILDFAVTMATLSGLYWVIIAVSGPWLWRNLAFWATTGLLGVLGMWFFYRLSIIAAEQYGEHFRAAFDLFRLQLLKALHRSHPDKLSQERRKWTELGQLIVFAHPESDIEVVAKTD